MQTRILFSAATCAALALSMATFASCKSNDINVNNSDDYESYVTKDADPGSDTTVDGPDHSQVVIPAGALTATTTIKIGKMKGGYPVFPDGWQTTGGIYSFEPHVQTFGKSVDIRVPYTDPGSRIRLAVSEPGGSWVPVDGAALKGGFASTASTHFSFYTVVTGSTVPPDPTLMDSGAPDATSMDSSIPDATPEAEAAAPPPPPTMFITAQDNVYRLFLDPAFLDPDAGADAGANDGGAFPVTNARSMAYVPSPQGLIVGTDPGLPDSGASLVTFTSPFGAMMQAGTIPLDIPGQMASFNGELWLFNNATSRLETYNAQGVMTWSDSTNTPVSGFAFHAATNKLYIVQDFPANLLIFTVSGMGGTKMLTPVAAPGDAGSTLEGVVVNPTSIVVTPWNELVIAGTAVHHFSLAGADLGIYATIGTMSSQNIAAVHWPSTGVDEVYVMDSEMFTVTRYAFATTDTTHSTPIKGQAIHQTGLNSMIVAP